MKQHYFIDSTVRKEINVVEVFSLLVLFVFFEAALHTSIELPARQKKNRAISHYNMKSLLF